MIVKLLTEHHLEFLSLKGGCTGSSESTLFQMPHCWKTHAMAQMEPVNDKPTKCTVQNSSKNINQPKHQLAKVRVFKVHLICYKL